MLGKIQCSLSSRTQSQLLKEDSFKSSINSTGVQQRASALFESHVSLSPRLTLVITSVFCSLSGFMKFHTMCVLLSMQPKTEENPMCISATFFTWLLSLWYPDTPISVASMFPSYTVCPLPQWVYDGSAWCHFLYLQAKFSGEPVSSPHWFLPSGTIVLCCLSFNISQVSCIYLWQEDKFSTSSFIMARNRILFICLQFFNPLFFRLDDFYWSVFKFTNSPVCYKDCSDFFTSVIVPFGSRISICFMFVVCFSIH